MKITLKDIFKFKPDEAINLIRQA